MEWPSFQPLIVRFDLHKNVNNRRRVPRLIPQTHANVNSSPESRPPWVAGKRAAEKIAFLFLYMSTLLLSGRTFWITYRQWRHAGLITTPWETLRSAHFLRAQCVKKERKKKFSLSTGLRLSSSFFPPSQRQLFFFYSFSHVGERVKHWKGKRVNPPPSANRWERKEILFVSRAFCLFSFEILNISSSFYDAQNLLTMLASLLLIFISSFNPTFELKSEWHWGWWWSFDESLDDAGIPNSFLSEFQSDEMMPRCLYASFGKTITSCYV